MRSRSVGEAEPSRQDRLKPKESNPLPKSVRKEIAGLARKLKSEHKALFASDAQWRKRAGQFLTALLPPKPRRRGRPGRPDVTEAIRLLKVYRRQFPDERPAQHWARMYPAVIPGYDARNPVEQRDARERLRERVRWRVRRSPNIGRTPRRKAVR